MKTSLPVLFVFLFQLNTYSQETNLVFYSQEGERFYVILNGIRQNQEAETNVKVTGLKQPGYRTKIIFSDTNLGEIDKNLMFNPGTETVIAIKKNRKGEYVMRWQSEVLLAEAPPPAPNQHLVVFTTTAPPVQQTQTVSETTSTTVTNATPNTHGGSMNVSVNDNSTGVSMNVNINDGRQTQHHYTQTTTYSTITTTTTAGGAPLPDDNTVYHLPGYNGPTGCALPMSNSDFSSAKNSVSSKSFEDSRLTLAKQIASSNCLLSDQVKDIMLLFDFEDTRLEFAKYAYGHTYDTGNFYKVNDAFDFESSIDELNEHIGAR